MATLNPQDAADAAGTVYQIIDSKNVAQAFKLYPSLLENFDLTSKSRFEGTAGALIFKYRPGFGVIAKGKGRFKVRTICH